MTYQNSVIKQFIERVLTRKGIFLEDESLLDDLVEKNIRGLNEGDKIAVDFDSEQKLLLVRRLDGFGCLHKLGEGALIISYAELERYFNEQRSFSVEFSE